MRNRAYFFPIEYVYLPLRGERSRELNRLLSYWLSLPKVALHLHKVEGFWTLSRRWTRPIQSPTVAIARCRSCRRKSPALHWNEWDRVALSLVVWTGLKAVIKRSMIDSRIFLFLFFIINFIFKIYCNHSKIDDNNSHTCIRSYFFACLLHRIVRSTWKMCSLRKHSEGGTRFETATLIGLIADEWQFNYIQWTMRLEFAARLDWWTSI